jgi:hypothetical protein
VQPQRPGSSPAARHITRHAPHRRSHCPLSSSSRRLRGAQHGGSSAQVGAGAISGDAASPRRRRHAQHPPISR